jgi:hypothetical protein
MEFEDFDWQTPKNEELEELVPNPRMPYTDRQVRVVVVDMTPPEDEMLPLINIDEL